MNILAMSREILTKQKAAFESIAHWHNVSKYEACPESKDTKVLNMYNFFNLHKRHCEWIAFT
jgi:hypothetical protein